MTTGKEEPKLPSPEPPEPGRKRPVVPRRYVVTLYARATEEEKRRIERKARSAGLSVSRYLVRAGAEERPPPTREERTRLEDLLYLFKRASLFLDELATNADGLERAGASAPMQRELREAARLLSSLASELKRRL
jgi:hypothetical protein